jgi:predicted methyltransferase
VENPEAPALPPLLPLLAQGLVGPLRAAAAAGGRFEASLDLGRSRATVEVLPGGAAWRALGQDWPMPGPVDDRTVLHWDGAAFVPVQRWQGKLYKLVATPFGPPTFEIDGVKMLPSAEGSPWDDAARKVALVAPRGQRVLDTCGGLGYFAAWCLRRGATAVDSWEQAAAVHWLRSLNPWSPGSPASLALGDPLAGLRLAHGDIAIAIEALPDAAYGAVLHDPPRFALAGELYSQRFYDQLARVLRRRGRLFHWTGAPNSRSRGRDLASEVVQRLRRAGFNAAPSGDGVLAAKE